MRPLTAARPHLLIGRSTPDTAHHCLLALILLIALAASVFAVILA